MYYSKFKKKVNDYLYKHIDGDNRPIYFDIQHTYPALDVLTKNFSLIKKEFEDLYRSKLIMPKYHEIDPGETEISNTTDHNWNVFMFHLLGHIPKENCQRCPMTASLLKEIPNLVQAFFSILDPGKSVPLHKGPYYGYLRYHLGLHVPSTNPPSIVVNSQKYTWKEGEAVLFDDSWPHEVINEATDFRAVLIVDVLRPMAKRPHRINQFITNVLAKHTYGRQVMRRVKKQQEITNQALMR